MGPVASPSPRGATLAACLVLLLAQGCYEPLGDVCHPDDPTCNAQCAGRECGPVPSDPEQSCGACPQGQGCTAEGQCSGDCDSICPDGHCREGSQCCRASDCGSGAWACGADHACACAAQACGDGYCQGDAGCCGASDCGSGAWTCDPDHACVCPSGPACPDGSCPQPGGCCADVQDDDRCGPDAICESHQCVRGEAGALAIGPGGCMLDGAACPGELIAFDGAGYVLLDGSRCFADVSVDGAVLSAPAIAPDGSGGQLVLCSTGTVTVGVAGRISMSGRGYGGGGGGGGVQYCSWGTPGVQDSICDFGLGGATGAPDPNGLPGGEAHDLDCMI